MVEVLEKDLWATGLHHPLPPQPGISGTPTTISGTFSSNLTPRDWTQLNTLPTEPFPHPLEKTLNQDPSDLDSLQFYLSLATVVSYNLS